MILLRKLLSASLGLAAVLLLSAPAAGQSVTAGSISGTVSDQQGGALKRNENAAWELQHHTLSAWASAR